MLNKNGISIVFKSVALIQPKTGPRSSSTPFLVFLKIILTLTIMTENDINSKMWKYVPYANI